MLQSANKRAAYPTAAVKIPTFSLCTQQMSFYVACCHSTYSDVRQSPTTEGFTITKKKLHAALRTRNLIHTSFNCSKDATLPLTSPPASLATLLSLKQRSTPIVTIEGLQFAVRYRPFPQPTSHTIDPASSADRKLATRGRIDPTGSSQFSYTSWTYARSRAAERPLRSLTAAAELLLLSFASLLIFPDAVDTNDDSIVSSGIVKE